MRSPGAAPSSYDSATIGMRENEHKRENDGKKYSIDITFSALKKKKPTIELLTAAKHQ